MKLKIIVLTVSVLLVSWLVFYSDDKRVGYVIEKRLDVNDSLLFRDIFDSGDKICLLPPYTKPESIKNFISIKDFEYLNSDLNRFIYGWEDGFWWLIKIESNKRPRVFGITGLTRPDFNYSQCIDFNKAKISLSNKEENYIYFTFFEE